MSSYFKMYISAAIILIVAAGCGNVNSTANTNTSAPPQTLLLTTHTSCAPPPGPGVPTGAPRAGRRAVAAREPRGRGGRGQMDSRRVKGMQEEGLWT